jgi:hypothetical protein
MASSGKTASMSFRYFLSLSRSFALLVSLRAKGYDAVFIVPSTRQPFEWINGVEG